MFPSVRDGLSSPSRSYRRSVCGWMLYFCATALIMKYALPVFFMIRSPAQLVADVFGVEAAELAHQFLRPFIEHARQHQPHFDDEIAARAAAG